MCGADVEIHSLVRSPEVNGVHGKVVEPQDPGGGRWGVKIDSDGRVLALKPSNLVLIRKHAPMVPRPMAQAVRRRLEKRLNELQRAPPGEKVKRAASGGRLAGHRGAGVECEALALMRDVPGAHPGDAGAIHNLLGMACVLLGNVSKAIGYFKQRLAITMEVGDRAGEGKACGNLGCAYRGANCVDGLARALRAAEGGLSWTDSLQMRQAAWAPTTGSHLSHNNGSPENPRQISQKKSSHVLELMISDAFPQLSQAIQLSRGSRRMPSARPSKRIPSSFCPFATGGNLSHVAFLHLRISCKRPTRARHHIQTN
jgi:hypothetical protein